MKCARLCQSTDCCPTSRTKASNEGLVHERRLLHRVIGALAPQVTLRELAQLLVHDCGQLRECAFVAIAPLGKQLSHGLLHRVIHADLQTLFCRDLSGFWRSDRDFLTPVLCSGARRRPED